jgi:hypothetical protein
MSATTLRAGTLRVAVAVVMPAVVAAATSGPALAEPGVADNLSGGCQFTLSAPEGVEIPGGAHAATATLQAGACTGNPTSATVCVTLPNMHSECTQAVGFTLARVTVAGPITGRVTATGTGCWRPVLAQPFQCATKGPVFADL